MSLFETLARVARQAVGLELHAGTERWAVKTGIDSEAFLVSPVPVATTIAELRSLTPPRHPGAGRCAPVEATTYTLTARIVLWKLEADGDYHLVLRDSQGLTMIAEIPDPDFVGPTSPWAGAIAACRANFVASPPLAGTVQVTGVGFWDTIHGQAGVAPNGVELHPVLSIARIEG